MKTAEPPEAILLTLRESARLMKADDIKIATHEDEGREALQDPV